MTSYLEFAARDFEAPPRSWATPGELARHLRPETVQTPALDLIDAELVRAADEPGSRLIISMSPQEGKSTRVAGDFPTWVLAERPETRIITASYGQALANRNGRAIRRRITGHPELGLAIAPDNGSVHDWTLDGHEGGVLSVGVGAGVTGRPADLLIIDDPIKSRAEADSETYRDRVWDWWTDEASTRLAPDASVVIILTRWHHDDLAARLVKRDADAGWRVVNIPAQADHDPAAGEADVLGREPGEFMVSARGWLPWQWEKRKRTAGARTWASLYQGRPTPDTGSMFAREQWDFYTEPLHLERRNGQCIIVGVGLDDMLISWDMTFKDTKGTDYVVGQVWLRRDAHAYLLDQVRARMNFTATVAAFEQLAAKWPQAILKLVEDKANGPAVIATLAERVPGIVPEEPLGSKTARAAAISPLVEARNVHLPAPKLAPWVGELVEEAAEFPAGAHDDQVDAMSQALARLILVPFLAGDDMPDDPADALGYDDNATAYLTAFG